jgi:hypothetical protein
MYQQRGWCRRVSTALRTGGVAMVFGRCVQAGGGGGAMVFDRGCSDVGLVLNKANQVT